MNDPLPLIQQTVIFSVIALSIVLAILNTRLNSLLVSVLNRWTRWIGVSLGGAFLIYETGWTDRPYWSLAIICVLLWTLLETLYNWMAISALSQSNLALFPKFRENNSGEEWPASSKLIELRDWLRNEGFKKAQALFADMGNGILIRTSIFKNEEDSTRIQILFMPTNNGSINHCVSISSDTKDGKRLVTDNMYLPYGGFYPDDWLVVRKPWKRNASSLLKIHRKRIQELDLESYDSEPMDEINQQQRLLERVNMDAGFLMPIHLQEEMGRITWEGRYRVWKEVWLMSYFGISSQK